MNFNNLHALDAESIKINIKKFDIRQAQQANNTNIGIFNSTSLQNITLNEIVKNNNNIISLLFIWEPECQKCYDIIHILDVMETRALSKNSDESIGMILLTNSNTERIEVIKKFRRMEYKNLKPLFAKDENKFNNLIVSQDYDIYLLDKDGKIFAYVGNKTASMQALVYFLRQLAIYLSTQR